MSETVTERFLRLIAPRRRAGVDRHVAEDGEFVAMLWRMVRAMEARTIDDPANLPQVVALHQRLGEVVNVAIASNAERYAVDPRRGASMMECARILGITKQSASDRRKLGEKVMAERIDAAGAARFSEARRERAAIDAAAERAVTSLADWRNRNAVA